MTRLGIGARRRRTLAAGVVAILALSACHSSKPSGPLPKAPDLLPRAVAAMRAVTSARFELTGRGKIQGVEVDRADGILTSTGDASGTVQITQAGLLVRHHFESGKAVFELNQGGHHDHLVCVQCGRVEEFFDPEIEKRQAKIAKERGFQIAEHALYLYAECTKPKCPHRPGGHD